MGKRESCTVSEVSGLQTILHAQAGLALTPSQSDANEFANGS
jgi:hypothetical protein